MNQQERSVAMLSAVDLEPDGLGPGSRYPRSSVGDGVSIWATAIPAAQENQFGVQFTAPALERGNALAAEFERCGFRRRPEADDKLTYYRLLDWSEDGSIDSAEAWLIRRATDGIRGG